MKNIIKSFILTACALSGILFTSCNKEYSEEVMNAMMNAEVSDKHIKPIMGEYANGVITLRCEDSLFVDYYADHIRTTHTCASKWQIAGGDVESNIINLDGCYDVDSTTGIVLGTNLRVFWTGDYVEGATVQLSGIPDPIDFSTRLTPCHLELKQICFDRERRKLVAHGVDENGMEAIAEGDWTGLIIVSDTVILRDTTYVHDTINHRDTIIMHDTVVVNDTTVVTRTTTVATEHISWNPTAQQVGGKLYVYGTDRITVKVMENGVIVSNNSTTYQHRSRFGYSGISTLSLPNAVDTCANLVNSHLSVRGHQVTTSWEADEIVDAAVMVNGVNYRSQLTPCHAVATHWCFSHGNATCHFDNEEGDEVATYTTTYNTYTPSTGIDLPGDCLAVYVTDSYVNNGGGMTTWICALYNNNGAYVMYIAPLTANTVSDFTSTSVSTDGYNRYLSNYTNANWALAKVTTSGAPSVAGYVTHNSDANIGDYWYTINDGVARNHCNIGGYANGWDTHSPIHYRNVSGGTTHVNTSVHGTTVNITLQ